MWSMESASRRQKPLKLGDRQCVYKDGSDRRVDSNRHPCFAEVPVNAAHDGQRLARYRGEQVLVGGVLRAAGVGMWHPHRRQSEIDSEDVVRQRAAEIGQDCRRHAGGDWFARMREKRARRTPRLLPPAERLISALGHGHELAARQSLFAAWRHCVALLSHR